MVNDMSPLQYLMVGVVGPISDERGVALHSKEILDAVLN